MCAPVTGEGSSQQRSPRGRCQLRSPPTPGITRPLPSPCALRTTGLSGSPISPSRLSRAPWLSPRLPGTSLPRFLNSHSFLKTQPEISCVLAHRPSWAGTPLLILPFLPIDSLPCPPGRELRGVLTSLDPGEGPVSAAVTHSCDGPCGGHWASWGRAAACLGRVCLARPTCLPAPQAPRQCAPPSDAKASVSVDSAPPSSGPAPPSSGPAPSLFRPHLLPLRPRLLLQFPADAGRLGWPKRRSSPSWRPEAEIELLAGSPFKAPLLGLQTAIFSRVLTWPSLFVQVLTSSSCKDALRPGQGPRR